MLLASAQGVRQLHHPNESQGMVAGKAQRQRRAGYSPCQGLAETRLARSRRLGMSDKEIGVPREIWAKVHEDDKVIR
jgi:hypothetical protein